MRCCASRLRKQAISCRMKTGIAWMTFIISFIRTMWQPENFPQWMLRSRIEPVLVVTLGII